MSQERTEQQQYVQMMVDKIMTRGEEVGIEDAIAEAITLLNATINGQASALREQTAKVQERDETIKEWERRFGTRTNTDWDALKGGIRRLNASKPKKRD